MSADLRRMLLAVMVLQCIHTCDTVLDRYVDRWRFERLEAECKERTR